MTWLRSLSSTRASWVGVRVCPSIRRRPERGPARMGLRSSGSASRSTMTCRSEPCPTTGGRQPPLPPPEPRGPLRAWPTPGARTPAARGWVVESGSVQTRLSRVEAAAQPMQPSRDGTGRAAAHRRVGPAGQRGASVCARGQTGDGACRVEQVPPRGPRGSDGGGRLRENARVGAPVRRDLILGPVTPAARERTSQRQSVSTFGGGSDRPAPSSRWPTGLPTSRMAAACSRRAS